MSAAHASGEFDHVLRILRGEDSAHAGCQHAHFLQLVSDHRLIGQVAGASHNHLDPDLSTELQEQNMANKLAQLQLMEWLNGLHHDLADIPFVLLKGPGLSLQLYGDPAERRSRDLDILIRIEDFDRVMEALGTKGYRILTPYRTPKQRASLLKHYQNIELLHPSGDVHLEVHWSMASLRSVDSPPYDALTLEHIQLGSQAYAVLALYDNLSYLSVHGTLHAFFRLQWLIDIRALRRQLKDEADFLQFLESRNWTVYYAVACALLHSLFGDPMPDFGSRVSRRKVEKLCTLCQREIALNDSFQFGTHRDGGFRATLLIHRLRYLTGGWKSLSHSLVSRNVRPENWNFFAFPDALFFLNHLCSRPIWLCRKLFSRHA